ncbi:hypothetical protein AGABI2DRAFT_186910 [Agaricus bisporus var. bisporus H97]|uniref:hypothetical protein n=1 Tax=Agaricus bisporus var. bisporus (strain H97 / ATCC MYA-4626 / FGSC 10389) TaxID=936046 RepID=UPI00029F5A4A|nr:hypothetical protein AGABI2DRAFT_186910 [Agaricus bisporus var. bisporus H97]EKV45136.1 hypothetical protein AGABI2DRAFT_186910 [Agaricus bisporus var. bisporus H97]
MSSPSTSPEPVVCQYFMLPPDEGDMRLIIHSLYDIMHVLDEFYLVLLDLPQSYDIVDIFRELRSEISLVCNGIILAYMFMTSYPNEYRLMPAALGSDTQQFKKFAYVGRTYAGSASTQLGKTIPKDFSEGAQRFGEGMERLDLLLQSRGLDGGALSKDAMIQKAEKILHSFDVISQACQRLAECYQIHKQHCIDLKDSPRQCILPSTKLILSLTCGCNIISGAKSFCQRYLS